MTHSDNRCICWVVLICAIFDGYSMHTYSEIYNHIDCVRRIFGHVSVRVLSKNLYMMLYT